MTTATFTSPEVASFWRFIASSLDRLIGVLDGMSAEDLNWRPPAPETNSLYVLAVHTMGTAEENIIETLCGRPVGRRREEEFATGATAASMATLLAHWQELRARLEAVLAELPTAELDRERPHPRRGALTGREVLIVVARHTAEHLGQAELTRDLLNAARQRR